MGNNKSFFENSTITIGKLSIAAIEKKVELKMHIVCGADSFVIIFHNVSRINIVELSAPLQVEGFQIIDNIDLGWDRDSRYKICDFENESMSFYCEKYDFVR